MTSNPPINSTEYPKFISNRPCGKDKFSGDSQNRLAKSIAAHFKRNDSLRKEAALPRIIGIEGGWGSGKSNVVKLLKNEFLKDYHFFEYDAWGHQEDLQRRSFLELLTKDLITEKVLIGETYITKKDGEPEEVKWDKKLSYLLARKTERNVKTFPLISGGVVIIAAVTILTPIFSYLAESVIPNSAPWVRTLFSAIPLIIGVLIGLRKTWNLKNKWSYLLALYQDKVTNDVTYETISEDEPTAREFKEWMNDVSKSIAQNNKPKLVVVFDNMDRLPTDKVKELWSSIHTFFAEDGFENVWAIIPFDQEHLACAFANEDEGKAKELTKYFIAKTFPIVYRVPAPVITDYKDVFNTLFEEAFGQTQNNDKELINRIYRLEKPDPNIRDIIVFINKLVALRMQWIDDNISLINMALFVLYQEKVLVDSVETILSGGYMSDKISKIISNTEELQEQVSALTYGVDINVAKQIPLTKYIQGCFNSDSGHDINKYADLKSFDSILEEVIDQTDESLIDKVIECLDGLNKENQTISKLWNKLADKRIKQPLSQPKFEDVYKILLPKTDSTYQKRIVSEIVHKITNLNEFDGGHYWASLSTLDGFLYENKIEATLHIEEKTVQPQTFIEYVFAADEDYTKYKLKTDPNGLDDFFTAMMPDKLTITAVIPILNKSQEYSFNNLLQRIEKAIADNEVTETNFEPIMFCYKNLSTNKPLGKQLSATTISTLVSSFDSKKQDGNYPNEYYDTVAMSLATGVNVGDDSPTTIDKVSKLMDYYASYGTLMENCVTWNAPILNQVLKRMTITGLGKALSIEKILPQYDNIKSKIDVTDNEFLTQLSRWSKYAPKVITKENIQTVIPSAKFYSKTASIPNALTAHINKMAIEALKLISTDELYQQRGKYDSYYWHLVINAFINTEYIKDLPDNITEFGNKILSDISSDGQSLPLIDHLQSIVDKLDKTKVISTVIDVRNNLCNDINTITVIKFKFLEPWLRETGDLEKRAGEVVDKILRPVIADSSCLNIIVDNSGYYIELIQKAGDAAREFKKSLSKMAESSKDKVIIDFAERIGIVFDAEEKK